MIDLGLMVINGRTVRNWARDEVPMAVFSGQVPTVDEVFRARRRGFGIHPVGITLADRSRDFVKLLRGVAHLGIASSVTGVSWVSELVELEVLSLYVSQETSKES